VDGACFVLVLPWVVWVCEKFFVWCGVRFCLPFRLCSGFCLLVGCCLTGFCGAFQHGLWCVLTWFSVAFEV